MIPIKREGAHPPFSRRLAFPRGEPFCAFCTKSQLFSPAFLCKIFLTFFTKTLDKLPKVWYNIYVIKRGHPEKREVHNYD